MGTDAYVEIVYKNLRECTTGSKLIFEDHVIRIIGTTGLAALKASKLLEESGAVCGLRLYTLCCEGES